MLENASAIIPRSLPEASRDLPELTLDLLGLILLLLGVIWNLLGFILDLLNRSKNATNNELMTESGLSARLELHSVRSAIMAVSYTHLTLPTLLLV